MNFLFSICAIAILLLLGKAIKHRWKLLQVLYIPESIIAGAIALFLGPEVLGRLALFGGVSADAYWARGLFPPAWQLFWGQCPEVLITVVFAGLFLGETIPHPRDIWRNASPQIAFGQSLAWGQYFFALLLSFFILVPFFHIDPLVSVTLEMGFEGGHATAAAMAGVLDRLGFADGGDMALGLATVGIVSGIICGILLAEWGRDRGHVETLNSHPEAIAPQPGTNTPQPTTDLVDPLSLNLGFIGLAIFVGWSILQGCKAIESLTWGKTGFALMDNLPLFPLAVVGGILVQWLFSRLSWDGAISRPLQERIGGFAVDVIVVTGFASIQLTAIAHNLAAFLLLSIVGILWNVGAFVLLAPRLLPIHWFERGIGDMGQSMGVTATGIILIRMVDPQNQTGAYASFAYKQLLFAPIVGGGIFTAASPTLIRQFGAFSILLLTGGLLAFWLIFGLWNFRKIKGEGIKPEIVQS